LAGGEAASWRKGSPVAQATVTDSAMASSPPVGGGASLAGQAG